MPSAKRHRVAIVGAGFGGMYAARRLGRDDRLGVTLVDHRNHIVTLAGFANRLVVLVRWTWSFVTHGRGSRLITGQPLLPDIEDPEPPG